MIGMLARILFGQIALKFNEFICFESYRFINLIACQQNAVFNSFCDKSTTSLDQQTLCTSPCHIAQPSKKPEVSKDAQNSNTVETASQTLLTMEKFSTNHNHSSSSSKTRDRRKSPSPRLRKSSLDLGKSLSKTARNGLSKSGF